MANVLYIVVLTATLAALASARVQRDCGITTCKNFQGYSTPEKHVSCLYNEGQYAPRCRKMISQGLTEREKQEILQAHNDFRRKVASGDETRGNPGPQPGSDNLGPLTWDQDLADLAQLWANQCVPRGHDECRDTRNQQVGQNIERTMKEWYPEIPADYKSQLQNMTEMVTDWSDEVENVDGRSVGKFDSSRSKGVISHYTQMVWAGTKTVGCGLTRYSDEPNVIRQMLVCNYGPTGNWIGQPIYNPVYTNRRQPTSGSNGPRPIPNTPQRLPFVNNRIPMGPQRTPIRPNRIPIEPQRKPIRTQHISTMSYYTQDGQRLCACAN